MKLACPLYFCHSSSTVSLAGPHMGLAQTPALAKAMTLGLPEETAAAMVMSCISGLGGDEESISVMSFTSLRIGCTEAGAGVPSVGDRLFSRTWNARSSNGNDLPATPPVTSTTQSPAGSKATSAA